MATRRCMPPLSSRTGFVRASPRPSSVSRATISAFVAFTLMRWKCRTIFSTHLHELAQEIDAINARTKPLGGVAIDTLVAGIEEGERSFRILRTKPDGKSYARDIAAKYGLTYDNILHKIGQNQNIDKER